MTLSDLFGLDGRVALVTGGSSGIGAACVQAFRAAGAVVAALDRSPASADLPLEVDVTDDAALTDAVSAVNTQLGAPTIVLANAGVPLDEGAAKDDLDVLDAMYRLHVRSVYRLAQLTVPAMAAVGGGSFLVTSSIAGLRGNKILDRYGITKAANAQIARNLAVQWGPRNVRANAISPGVIETPFSGAITEDPAVAERRKAITPLGRFGTADEVAGTVLWLASPSGAFVTGQNIVIDGGTLIND